MKEGYKKKLRVIILAYLLLNKKGATSKDLANFISKNFKFKEGVTAMEIAVILKERTNPYSILYGVDYRIENIDKKHSRVYYI